MPMNGDTSLKLILNAGRDEWIRIQREIMNDWTCTKHDRKMIEARLKHDFTNHKTNTRKSPDEPAINRKRCMNRLVIKLTTNDSQWSHFDKCFHNVSIRIFGFKIWSKQSKTKSSKAKPSNAKAVFSGGNHWIFIRDFVKEDAVFQV